MVQACGVLYMFTSKRASRHNGVHFFNISTSKSAPSMVCFVHVHFKMRFAPQRRALFQHLNFQKCSDHGVFWHFSLPNVLRATTACTFSCLFCPDVFALAALAALLFDPPEPQNTRKTQCFATSLPFRTPASSLFWLSPSLIFSLLTFSTSEFLPGSAFPSVHIVESFDHTRIYMIIRNLYKNIASYVCVYLFIYLFVFYFIYLFGYLFICLFIYLFI